MKKFSAILTFCTFMLCNLLIAQKPGSEPDFYTITSNLDSYYDSLRIVTPDSVKIQGLKMYERWREF